MKYVWGNLVVAGCLVLGWMLYQYNSAEDGADSAERQRANIAVEVVEIVPSDLEERAELTGSLEAQSVVQIRSRAAAYIRGLPFDVGQFVQSDEAVIQLDQRHPQEVVASATAALRVAEAQLRAREGQLKQATGDVRRLTSLQSSGASTRQQLDQAVVALEIAEAEVDLEAARVKQAQAELQSAELALSDTIIVSPIDGVVAERLVEPGDLAQPDDILLKIVDISKVRTVVHVVEQDYQRVRIGQRADITVDALPDQRFRGQIIRRSPVIDEETRTAAIHIEIDNASGQLRPGMPARVSIVLEQHSRVAAIPVTALLAQGESVSVFVLDENHNVRRRAVRTGIRSGELVEIREGLRPGQRVVTLGAHLVEEGQAVEPTMVQPEAIGLARSEPETSERVTVGE